MRPSMSDAVRLVVDSSVAVKWFVAEGEAGVAEALTLLDGHLSRRCVLAAPSHLLLEVLNALSSRGLDEPDLRAAARSLLGAQLELTPAEQLAEKAAGIAATHGLTVYDAAFAALADELGCDLVTEDRRLAESGACRARGLGGPTPISLDLVTCGEDTD
jgi:predicted nucleic acid-binding protein